MKKVALLGASGSIGKNAITVMKNHPDEFQVTCLSAHTKIDYLVRQALELRPQAVVITSETRNDERLKQLQREGIQVFYGDNGLTAAIAVCDFDILVNALVGAVGLLPTLSALERGKSVALANKETLVMAGELVTTAARQHQAKLIPIDSEHSAIFQCLVGEKIENVSRIILTGSGGPFLHRQANQFSAITVAEALNHPKWKMGPKITIDSATLMNKGLEIIEAYWLFGVPLAKIDLVIHPQSIIHSLVEFVDGSIKAQLGWPDMKVPIQYALTYPGRRSAPIRELDFAMLKELTFFYPDHNRFPNLRLAVAAIQQGGSAPAVLNATNEVAVRYFLANKIPFTAIPALIEKTLAQHRTIAHPDLPAILAADQWAREFVDEVVLAGKI